MEENKEKSKKDTFEGLELTDEVEIEGVGVGRAYGELNIEKLVKAMLKSKSIIGGENNDKR